MNREQCKALLPVMQAWAEGKTIQVWDIDSRIWVSEGRNISFNLLPERYRIKPEKKKMWRVEWTFRDSSTVYNSAFYDRCSVDNFVKRSGIIAVSVEEYEQVLPE